MKSNYIRKKIFFYNLPIVIFSTIQSLILRRRNSNLCLSLVCRLHYAMSDKSAGIDVAAANDVCCLLNDGGILDVADRVRLPGDADHVRHRDVDVDAQAHAADADGNAHGVDDVVAKQLHNLTETFCRDILCKFV